MRTLGADEQFIEQAPLLAKAQHKTVNAMFREWLQQFTAQSGGAQFYVQKRSELEVDSNCPGSIL